MRTTAYAGATVGRRLAVVLLAAMAAVFVGVLLAQGAASAHDHKVPQTVLKKGAKELQAGTRMIESNGVYPSGDEGLCANENALYRTRFPETDWVAAGTELRVRIAKAQRPDAFEIAAYRAVDEDGEPTGEARVLDRTLKRVERDGKTVAWDAVFSVEGAGRDYYLVSEGHWTDREGCGGDQHAHWSFHVKTRGS